MFGVRDVAFYLRIQREFGMTWDGVGTDLECGTSTTGQPTGRSITTPYFGDQDVILDQDDPAVLGLNCKDNDPDSCMIWRVEAL